MTITLEQLIKQVKEQNLSKDQLEHYQQEMSYLYSDLMLEMAELEKEEAMFMATTFSGKENESVAQKKVNWKSTKSGQRLIVLKRYALATKTLLNSLKSRLYSIY